ncbi:hypothetical protein HMPREF0762_00798 [Slackia exigua ATCC 700122]|uniref:Uncharacterized protein n=1 Tax=Slackia exigua (strain ATCC 700122 / DSM 15923 / CIP 105133 / JCM 11022 / KCTC 5966 / S-7) TaxID=649764 RepID=D0WG47_SLAES|nr:hypothetical protein HMPREF0762_00798 [Slackia exigua ATCC 700122]STN99085.1 Uncharacterised protein [Slackia exigua]
MRLQVEALLQTEVLPQVKTLLQTEVLPQVKTLRIRFRRAALVGL